MPSNKGEYRLSRQGNEPLSLSEGAITFYLLYGINSILLGGEIDVNSR